MRGAYSDRVEGVAWATDGKAAFARAADPSLAPQTNADPNTSTRARAVCLPAQNIAVGSQIIQFSSPRSPPSVQHAGMFRVAV